VDGVTGTGGESSSDGVTGAGGGSGTGGVAGTGGADVLDCLGLRCPRPVIELAKRMQQVPAGGVLQVLSDDPVAGIDIPAWCWSRGQEYLGATGPDTYEVRRVS
jgi:TusA-related sulfurtransferase